MPVEKKNQKKKAPHPSPREDARARNPESEERVPVKEEKKVRRVNYVVKDLPIY